MKTTEWNFTFASIRGGNKFRANNSKEDSWDFREYEQLMGNVLNKAS